MKHQICCYSLDWLQLYCRVAHEPDTFRELWTSPQLDKFGNHRDYKLIVAKEYIKGYAQQRAVKCGRYVVAHIAWEPIGARREYNAAAIKLDNAILYNADWHFILKDILLTLEWTAVNITRMDLACDFNYFENGLYPETFIRVYMTKSSNTYIRHGSNKWAAIGVKDMQKNTFDYIRWGSRQSGVSVYLYNKSKELREQKFKPWIADLWKKHGLDQEKTWRVEISINSSGRGLKNAYNELIYSVFADDLYREQSIENIFKVYAQDYFKFYWKPKNGPTRKKDLKPVRLLPVETSLQLRPTTFYKSAESSRGDMLTLRRLCEMKEYLDESDNSWDRSVSMSLHEVIMYYKRKTSVAKYCDTFRKEIETSIIGQTKRFVPISEWNKRKDRLMDIKTDNEYHIEIARQIAQRIAKLNMYGIVDTIENNQ